MFVSACVSGAVIRSTLANVAWASLGAIHFLSIAACMVRFVTSVCLISRGCRHRINVVSVNLIKPCSQGTRVGNGRVQNNLLLRKKNLIIVGCLKLGILFDILAQILFDFEKNFRDVFINMLVS